MPKGMSLPREKLWPVAVAVHGQLPERWMSGTQVVFKNFRRTRKGTRLGSGYLQLSLGLDTDRHLDVQLSAQVSGKDATRYQAAVPELRTVVASLGSALADDDGEAPTTFRFTKALTGDILAEALTVERALMGWNGEDAPAAKLPNAVPVPSSGDAVWDDACQVFPRLPPKWEPTVYFAIDIPHPFFGEGSAHVTATVGVAFYHFQVALAIRADPAGADRFAKHGPELKTLLGGRGFEVREETIADSPWPLSVNVRRTVDRKTMAGDCLALESAVRDWLARSG